MKRLILGLLTSAIVWFNLPVNATNIQYQLVDSLTDPVPAANNRFGFSGVAISADGDTALVASPYSAVNGVNPAGKVYVYHFSGGQWSLLQEIDDPNPTQFDCFGCSIAVSTDGSIALIGSQAPVNGQTYAGKAFLYALNNGTYGQTYEFDDPAATADDYFGATYLSLSGDGKTVVISAYGTPVNGQANAGEAYIYNENGGTWSQVAAIPDPDAASNDMFGLRAVVSTDGSTTVISSDAPNNGNSGQSGKVFIYTLNNGAWVQAQELDDPLQLLQDFFGNSVALSSNGQTIIIGATGVPGPVNSGAGEVYIYNGSNGSWTQTASILDPNNTGGDYFGAQAALSGDGQTALIGSLTPVNGQAEAGIGYLYKLNSGTWTSTAVFNDPQAAANDHFSSDGVAMSSDGEALMFSASYTSVNGLSDAGEAYIYHAADDLSIALGISPSTVNAGQQTVLDITVTNNDSQITASNVTVTDMLPSGLSYASANGAGGSCSASTNTVTCVLASLAPGGTWKPSISVGTSGGGSISDTASVSSDAPDPSNSNNTATASVSVNGSSGGGGGSGGGSGGGGGGGGGAFNLLILGLLSGLLLLTRHRTIRR